VFIGNGEDAKGGSASISGPGSDAAATPQATAACVEAQALLRQMETLELLNLLTALQGERVEAYAGFNSALAVLVREERVDEYPLLCGETTSIFSVLSRRIIDIKDVLIERKQLGIAKLVQLLQDKEKDKLVLVAAAHLDAIQAATGTSLSSGPGGATSMTLLATPDVQQRIADVEADVSEVLAELQAAKSDLL